MSVDAVLNPTAIEPCADRLVPALQALALAGLAAVLDEPAERPAGAAAVLHRMLLPARLSGTRRRRAAAFLRAPFRLTRPEFDPSETDLVLADGLRGRRSPWRRAVRRVAGGPFVHPPPILAVAVARAGQGVDFRVAATALVRRAITRRVLCPRGATPAATLDDSVMRVFAAHALLAGRPVRVVRWPVRRQRIEESVAGWMLDGLASDIAADPWQRLLLGLLWFAASDWPAPLRDRLGRWQPMAPLSDIDRAPPAGPSPGPVVDKGHGKRSAGLLVPKMSDMLATRVARLAEIRYFDMENPVLDAFAQLCVARSSSPDV